VNEDRAADGLRPLQGALRTFRHLDLPDVGELMVEW